MNLFFGAALLLIVMMVAVCVWLACEPSDELNADGWWIFPSLMVSVLIMAGVLL